MTGAEVAAAGKVAKMVGENVLGEDKKTKDVLRRLAEGTPEMAAAARTMAARTLAMEQIKLRIIEPIARLFGAGKLYLDETLPEELAAKLAEVPDENIITPSSSVAGPTVLALSYTYDEPTLKEMYLNLLAAASDGRRADQAHPAFAEIIKQLAPEEARALSALFLPPRDHTVARVKHLLTNPKGFRILQANLFAVFDENHEPLDIQQLPTWLDNWQRLALINISYNEFASGPDDYDWVEKRPEYIRLTKLVDPTRLEIGKGLIRPTDFGRQFLSVVC
jgi:hypothetical protein